MNFSCYTFVILWMKQPIRVSVGRAYERQCRMQAIGKLH